MVSGSGSPMGMFMWATGNIHRYNLSADHTQATFLSTYSEGNAAFHYMDYSPGGQYLYYTRTGLTLGSATHQIMRQNLSNAVVSSVSGRGGDIRRTKHGTMLVATPAWLYADEAFTISNPNGASPTVAWGNFTGSAGRGEAAIGLQPLVYELLPAISTRSLNQKRYELTDHLGNVRAVVSDRKLCDNSALPTPPTLYRAEVLNQTDFYPFGMISRSTTASGGDYRFGFQGQEKDDEVYGAPGTSLAFEYRMNDPRIGRFLSIDPLVKNYPDISPYAYVANSPIVYVDIDGRELFIFGSVAYFNRLNAIVKKSFDGYFELIRDESNRVMMVSTKKCRTMQNPISGIERMDALSKTAQYKYLNQVINDSKITKMEVTADDPGTFGGAFRGRRNGSFGDDFNGDRQRIDVSDFEDVVSFKYMSGMALFIHELVEAYLDQTQGHIPVKTQAEFENIFPLYHGPALEAQASVDNIVQSINQSDPANPGVVENYALTKQGAWYKTQITFSGSNAKLIIGQTEEVKDVVLSPDQQRVKSSSPTGIIVPNTK
jgi:RHS repeat-associated protein